MNRINTFIFFLLITPDLLSQCRKPTMVAGPMLGYIEHKEGLIWIQTECAKLVTIGYYPEGKEKLEKQVSMIVDHTQGTWPATKVVLKDLEMATTYNYRIYLDGKEQILGDTLRFTTKSIWEFRTDPPPFSFLTGSCAYINDTLYDRPGIPYGKGTEIFRSMAGSKAEMMLWLGDNTYMREADYSSMSGIRYRYSHTRMTNDLQRLLRSMHHYAIWDDHDFGPNDANSSYELKDSALRVFTEFWGNKTFGQANDKGIYGRFIYADCEFFLLDDRYHRDGDEKDSMRPGRTMLGAEQLQWLKNGLSSSRASFKFICVGSQVLNEMNRFESFSKFPAELNGLLDHIASNKIRGVVFLSGDRHKTEMLKRTHKGVNIYELTTSPLTSGAFTTKGSSEENNPAQIPGTLVEIQNYCKISVSGKFRDRKLLISCHDKTGKTLWEKEFSEKDIR